MISVAPALQAVLNTTQDFGVEQIPFLKSVGRVSKEAIYADRDFPPFHRVSMDGISIDYTAFKNGQRSFRIAGTQAAGSTKLALQDSKNCMEVMTGSVLPDNTNTVIRYEDITIKNGIAMVHVDSLQKGQNIHEKGKDRKVGDLLIAKNTKIAAAEIGVLATVGKSFVKVAKHPKIMIVSTGDELVDVE
ncbi:molybdopterin molybdenumtransferase MoeA, partial [Polaribacter sp.]|nr:molybdopterin molybdenumtransferase MoeA [Polaribacter sp.]